MKQEDMVLLVAWLVVGPLELNDVRIEQTLRVLRLVKDHPNGRNIIERAYDEKLSFEETLSALAPTTSNVTQLHRKP